WSTNNRPSADCGLQVTRQRSGTESPSVEEDGRVRRPCPNQRNKSERKENMRQPQLRSMPASPWRSVPGAAGKPRCLPRRNDLSRSVHSGHRLGSSLAWGFLLQNGAVDADNLPASPLSQNRSSYEHRIIYNVRRSRVPSFHGPSIRGLMGLAWVALDRRGVFLP